MIMSSTYRGLQYSHVVPLPTVICIFKKILLTIVMMEYILLCICIHISNNFVSCLQMIAWFWVSTANYSWYEATCWGPGAKFFYACSTGSTPQRQTWWSYSPAPSTANANAAAGLWKVKVNFFFLICGCVAICVHLLTCFVCRCLQGVAATATNHHVEPQMLVWHMILVPCICSRKHLCLLFQLGL